MGKTRKHFYGQKSPDRLGLIQAGTYRGDPESPEPFKPYRKITLTWAVQMPEAFEVETNEGLMAGKMGDYLAVGAHGEMYPIDREVFDATYVPSPPDPRP